MRKAFHREAVKSNAVRDRHLYSRRSRTEA
jgi:hypothetical protein